MEEKITMKVIDLRILVGDDGSFSVVSIGQTGVDAMKATWRESVDRYLKWGNAQGGHGGRPWDDHYSEVQSNRLGWWERNLQVEYLSDITLSKVEEAMERIPGRGDQPPSSKTRREYVALIKSFLGWCLDREILQKHPLKLLRLPDSQPEKDYRALTADEYNKILTVAPPIRALFYEASVMTGLRKQELLDLTAENIDVASGFLVLKAVQTKNRKAAKIPAPISLLKRILDLDNNGGKIFPQHIDGDIGKQFGEDRENAEVAYKTPEGYATLTSLRDLRASMLHAGGASLVETQKLMRHSDPSVTARSYVNVANDSMRQHLEALSAKLMPSKVVPAVGVEPKSNVSNFEFTSQHKVDVTVTCESGKIEQLTKLVSVWFSLNAHQRGAILGIAGIPSGRMRLPETFRVERE